VLKAARTATPVTSMSVIPNFVFILMESLLLINAGNPQKLYRP